MLDPHAVTSLDALLALYGEVSVNAAAKVTDRLDPRTAEFIAASPFLLLGTVGARGVHVTPRGDVPGFVTVVDDNTLILPDRRGNNRLDGLRDILEDNRISLLFLVPGVAEALRVHGTAHISTDPALRAAHVAQGKEPATLLVVQVHELFMQCAKALMRSKLWAGTPRPAGVPTMGQLLASQTPGRVVAEEVDAGYPERIRTTMY
jgi:PPOX class probable FMN-dependent enzyme